MLGLFGAMSRVLCQVDDIPENGAKGFPGAEGTGLVAVRRGDRVFVYENSCPHIGTPLDWVPDRFLSKDGRFLICATHGAVFTPEDGMCVLGPCKGDALTACPVTVRDGVVYLGEGG
jgi:nitrite reductase/ring-hydroxylating ferredoxin subunit